MQSCLKQGAPGPETRYRLLYESLGGREATILKAAAALTTAAALDHAAELCRSYLPELDKAEAKVFLQWLHAP